MKTARHNLIRELVRANNIETQEELVKLLRENGFNVTQTTVSRDIKELKLVKKLIEETMTYCYTIADTREVVDGIETEAMFRRMVSDVECSGTIVVVKTVPGSASLVAKSVEDKKSKRIIGTIAGYDTVFIAAASAEEAVQLCRKYRTYCK